MARIFPLSEGEFTVGHDKKFIPFDEATDELTDRPTGSLHVEVQPFLVQTNDDLIVLDAGLGFKNKLGVLQIHENIIRAGFTPEAVTKVLLSHLHIDHAGGVVYHDRSQVVLPAFPNATYFIYRKEAEFALAQGAPSFDTTKIEWLLSLGNICFLDDESGFISPEIQYFHSGGHSPQHIVFLIDDGQDKIFYGGDEAPQLKQLKIKYIAKYDFDGKRAMLLRDQYATEGRIDKRQFLFYHDVKTPVAVL
jgi:glyoxylase-like metal-dependent hydrolase (beta-lactamase superfamily II)